MLPHSLIVIYGQCFKLGFRWFTGCCTTLISSLSIITLEQGRLFLSSAYSVYHMYNIYIFSRPKQKGKVWYYQNDCTSEYGLGFASYGPPPRRGLKGLDQFCLGPCDLPSNSPLFVGGKIMHRATSKREKHTRVYSIVLMVRKSQTSTRDGV